MMLALQLSPEDWNTLQEVLRIRYQDMIQVGAHPTDNLGIRQQYAWKILQARCALGLSGKSQDACYDYSGPEDSLAVVDLSKP